MKFSSALAEYKLLNVDICFLTCVLQQNCGKVPEQYCIKIRRPSRPSTKVNAWELLGELYTGMGRTGDETVKLQASLSLELGFAPPLTKLCRRSKGSQFQYMFLHIQSIFFLHTASNLFSSLLLCLRHNHHMIMEVS